jgi:hypothetical protein
MLHQGHAGLRPVCKHSREHASQSQQLRDRGSCLEWLAAAAAAVAVLVRQHRMHACMHASNAML